MPLNKLMYKEKLTVRLKSGDIEGSGADDYSGFWNAFNYVMDWSEEHGVESGGYIFEGGGALIYISPNATSSSWSPPGPVTLEESEGTYFSFYDEQAIAATFHTHLIEGGSEQLFSRADLYNQTACYPNCDLIILYNCNAYVYTFEHGMYIP
jgi:hypothetical protein